MKSYLRSLCLFCFWPAALPPQKCPPCATPDASEPTTAAPAPLPEARDTTKDLQALQDAAEACTAESLGYRHCSSITDNLTEYLGRDDVLYVDLR